MGADLRPARRDEQVKSELCPAIGIYDTDARSKQLRRAQQGNYNGTAAAPADDTDGIRINSPSIGNTIEENRLKKNIDHDCHDASTGNTWTDNEAQTSFPPDLCGEDEDADHHDDSDYGWDRNHNWNAEYDAPAEMDFTAAYGPSTSTDSSSSCRSCP